MSQPGNGDGASKKWTADLGRDLQQAVDRIVAPTGGRPKGLRFSCTIADPSLPDCPLVGCSEGFSTLCGYAMHEVLGRNCRFLVQPVPKEQVNNSVRCLAKDFCAAVQAGREYQLPEHRREAWMPKARASDDGVFCLQVNARKDGALFRSMYYMKKMELDGRRYIIALHTEVTREGDFAACHEACGLLDGGLGELGRALAPWRPGAERRQEERSAAGPAPPPRAAPAPPASGAHMLKKAWTDEQGSALQTAVDRVFGVAGSRLVRFRFSLTLADPHLEGCPLIGCSTGFGTLCGYEMHEIIGHNCRFLVDPVPKELINAKVRKVSREFCAAVREGRDFKIDEADREPWMPQSHASDDGVFCAQTNARKDGSLFENMFYLKRVELDERPYIAGLQTELPMGSLRGTRVAGSIDTCHQACRLLDSNFTEVERLLAGMFWYTAPMRRQQNEDVDDGFKKARPSENWGDGPQAWSSKVPAVVAVVVPVPAITALEASLQPRRTAQPPAAARTGRGSHSLFAWLCCRAGYATSDDAEDARERVVPIMHDDRPGLRDRE